MGRASENGPGIAYGAIHRDLVGMDFLQKRSLYCLQPVGHSVATHWPLSGHSVATTVATTVATGFTPPLPAFLTISVITNNKKMFLIFQTRVTQFAALYCSLVVDTVVATVVATEWPLSGH